MGNYHSTKYRYCHLCHIYKNVNELQTVHVMSNSKKNMVNGYQSVVIYEPDTRKIRYDARYDCPFSLRAPYKATNDLFLCVHCFDYKNGYYKWKHEYEMMAASKRIRNDRNKFYSLTKII
jgi:hypothetical protein